MFVLVSLISIYICIVYIHVAVIAKQPDIVDEAKKLIQLGTHSKLGTKDSCGLPNAFAAMRGR